MQKRIEVRSQAEFDACVKLGNIAVVINCRVEARENSSVVARENSSVEAWGNSSVEAWGNVFVRLFSALSVKASLHVSIMVHGKAKTLTGGKRTQANVPKTSKQWCAHYGVEVKKGVATLYKALNEGFVSPHGIAYAPGTIPKAPDWDGGEKECGGGLHFSPHPQMAAAFNTGAKLFVACPVALKDIVVHPEGQYPEKIKASKCCGPVWQVDRKGKKIEGAEI